MKKYTTPIVEPNAPCRGGEQEVYLAAEADARLIEEYRKGYTDAQADVKVTSGDYAALEARVAELEKALRYWMPDETLVEPQHAAEWDAHVKLLQQ